MKSRPPSKLIVAVLSVSTFLEVEKKADSRYEISGGIEGRFLKAVLTALGIEYELVFPADGEYGRQQPNGSWTGLMGMIQRGEADMACGGLILTEKRAKYVNFSAVYAISPLTFAIGKAKREILKNAYLYPFQAGVWMCFFGLFTFISAGMWVVYRGKYSIERIIFEVCGNALRQPFMLGGDSWNSKYLQAVCCVYAFVVTSGYSGVLFSFLTLPVEGKNIENFGQLSEAVKRGTHRCFVLKGTLAVPYLLSTNDQHLQFLGQAISNNSWYVSTEEAHNHKMINQNDAFISNTFALGLMYSSSREQNSKFLISKDTIATSYVGIAVNSKFCCHAKLNKILSWAQNAGLFEKYAREGSLKYWLSIQEQYTLTPVNPFQSISVEEISGALLILISGYLISITTLLTEILFVKYKENNDLLRKC